MISFCAEIKVSKQSVYAWLDKYPEFKSAHEIGMVLCENFWMQVGEDNIDNPNFNTNFYMFQMGSRFGISRTRKTNCKKIALKGSVFKNPKNLLERFNNAILSFPDGEISLEELDKIASAFMKISDIKEKEELSARVAEIELELKVRSR